MNDDFVPLIITIDGRPPTPNETNRQVAQARWRERREWRSRSADEASIAVRAWEAQFGEWRAPEKAAILIEFLLPDFRRRDFDNLVASTKPLLDGLVDAGALVDDSIRSLPTVVIASEFTPKRPGTRFTIGPAV